MKVVYNSSASGTGVASLGPWNSILSDTGDQCIKQVLNSPALPGLTSASNAGGGAAISTGNAPVNISTSSPSGSCGANTHLNCTAAVNWLQSNVTTTQDQGICLTDIQRALSAGGVTLQCGAPPGHSGYAGYCDSSLQALNFTALGSSDPSPQPGDILVIQHSTGTKIGHITMWTGSAWVSDFVQSNGESPPGNPYGSDGYDPQYWRP